MTTCIVCGHTGGGCCEFGAAPDRESGAAEAAPAVENDDCWYVDAVGTNPNGQPLFQLGPFDTYEEAKAAAAYAKAVAWLVHGTNR